MPMGTFIGRYRPIAIGTNASYDTKDEQAAKFVALMNTATSTPAVPNTTSGAVAKWVGVPIAAAGYEGVTATYNDQTKIAHGEQYLQVSSPDVTATAVTAPIADAIDKAVLGSMTVDGAMSSATTTTVTIHTAESAVGALVKAIVAIDGFCYLLVGDEAEVIKVTEVAGDNNETFTVVRGAAGSTASATWDDDEALYWYCGADNTVIGVDDESVWGTLANHTAAGGHLVVICGTEQMLVTDLVAGTIPDTFVATRGYDGTTAAVHADNAAVTQYIDEDTCMFTVDIGALLVDECFYKPAIAWVDGAMEAADTTEFALHAGDTDFGARVAQLIAEDGCAYLLIDAECVKATAIASDNITITCERGALGTTAETWLDNAPVFQYREGIAANARPICEVLLVKSISTHVITCTRGAYGSPKYPIASGDVFFRCWAYEALDAALTAANATSGMPDFEEYGGTPICTLGTVQARAAGDAVSGLFEGANVTGTVTEET